MSINQEISRLTLNISEEQKELFEKAATVGRFKNLNDFVVLTVQKHARQIIEENQSIIVSKRDAEIFIDAVLKPERPNKKIKEALVSYNAYLAD